MREGTQSSASSPGSPARHRSTCTTPVRHRSGSDEADTDRVVSAVVLGAVQRVVRDEGEHHDALAQDHQHEAEDGEEEAAGRSAPGSDSVQRDAAQPDPQLPHPCNTVGGLVGCQVGCVVVTCQGGCQQEEDYAGVEDVVQREHGLGRHQQQVQRVGQARVLPRDKV